jgi:hypothetical protein
MKLGRSSGAAHAGVEVGAPASGCSRRHRDRGARIGWGTASGRSGGAGSSGGLAGSPGGGCRVAGQAGAGRRLDVAEEGRGARATGLGYADVWLG